jgi:cellulose synthase/poly-beta-1,6-N-acetylglucosamine synthase-like glycosyltransferase
MNNEQIMILVAVIAFIYVQLIMRFTFGWFSLDKVAPTDNGSSFSTRFSVIIAARNEEQTITRCLEAIALQNYPVDLFEVIIVNDHSTDTTIEVVHEFITGHPGISVRLLDGVGEGKKRAISEGIKVATGRLILVTDADCLMSDGWIRSFAVSYEKKGSRCISGPVKMTGKGIFADIQGLEFMSLIGSGAGGISAGMPVMCNGANFCYEKTAFEAVSGFEDNHHYASGDDVFLMLKINKRYGSGSVGFLKDRAAIVTTEVQPDLRSFLNQRIRWTSKSPGYTDFGVILTAVSVLLINLGILISFGYGLFFGNFQLFLFLLISKLIIDLPLLITVSSFMHQKRLLTYYLPVQLLMPFYVVFTALGGLLSTVSWKGRPVK